MSSQAGRSPGACSIIGDNRVVFNKGRYDLPAPDPIAALEYFIDSRGWTRKQLEPYIGSRGRVSEILSRKRPLTLPMIRRLEQDTGISGSILIQPYETEQDDHPPRSRDVPRHERMVSLVERMLDLHKRVAAEHLPHAKTMLQRQIEVTDRQIDALVYELCGLTEAEVAVVDGCLG